MSTVERLKATGIGILLVEQAVEAAVSVADRVCVLDVGRVVLQQSGAPDVEVIKRAYFGVAQ
jgi:branched-chain amino acid transport system ATP-binding protein